MVEPPPAQKPHPPFWVAAGNAHSIRRAAARGFNLILDQYASAGDRSPSASRIYKAERQAHGSAFDPMQVTVARQLYVAKDEADKQAALMRQAAYTKRTVDVSRRPTAKAARTCSPMPTRPAAPRKTRSTARRTRSAPMLEALQRRRRRLCPAHDRRRQRATAPFRARDHAGFARSAPAADAAE